MRRIAPLALAFGAALFGASHALAVTSYPPAALLQTGDITSTHIRNNTIVGSDVSTTTHLYVGGITASSTGTSSVFAGGVTLGSAGVTFADGTTQTTRAGSVLQFDILAAEAMPAGTPVMVGTTSTTSITFGFSNVSEVGFIDATTRAGQKWVNLGTTRHISHLAVRLFRTGSATGTLNIVFDRDINDDGIGDGTQVATFVADVSLVVSTATPGAYVLFPVSYDVQPGLRYVWYVTGTGWDGSNYISVRISTGADYGSGNRIRSLDSWSSTSTMTEDLDAYVYAAPAGQGRAYRAERRLVNNTGSFVGFTSAAVATSATTTVTFGGVLSVFSGLMPGMVYTLGSATGTIAAVAATSTERVGTALSSTSMLVTPMYW